MDAGAAHQVAKSRARRHVLRFGAGWAKGEATVVASPFLRVTRPGSSPAPAGRAVAVAGADPAMPPGAPA